MSKHTPGPWKIRYPHYPNGYYITFEQHTANAQLMAAAPDMYEALSSLENDSNQMPDFMWDIVQAALKKARGEV